METVETLDILTDPDLQRRVLRLSLACAGVTAAVVALVFVLGLGEGAGVWWWVALALGILVPLPVHELVHGAAFKLLCPGCRVSFGLKESFLYTKTDGATARRWRMVVVLLAPAVLVTAGVAALAVAAGCPALATLLAGLHLAGCAGDLTMAAAALREPRCTHARDTETGLDLLRDRREGLR